jgi:uncharacterized YceG family protein
MKAKLTKFILWSAFSVVFLVVTIMIVFYAWTKQLVEPKTLTLETTNIVEVETGVSVFPVGVNSLTKTITENPAVDFYVDSNLAIDTENSRAGRFLDRLLAEFVRFDWYQNLASSVSRILVIYPGERHEEIVKNFGDILKWTVAERDLFYNYIVSSEPVLTEGKFYPGRYIVSKDATPEEVADLLEARFREEILTHYTHEIELQVPLEEALVIASLLEREAYDFTDMRYISGVIWNRLFIDMPLQLDATLQYARGSKASESRWWPRVLPRDKFIESPYNTYEHSGLPPTPIANPSAEAVIAALNPRITKCMFYFHDSKGKFYCTETYEEHVAKLKEIYGRGR